MDGMHRWLQIRSELGGSSKINSIPSTTQRLLKLELPTSPRSGKSEERLCRNTYSASEKSRTDATHRAPQRKRQSIWLFWDSLSRSRIWLFSWNSPPWHTWCRSLQHMSTIIRTYTRKNSSAMLTWPKLVIPMILARNKKWL